MTELFVADGVADRRLVAGARGLLATFNTAGVLEAADVHVATRLGELVGDSNEVVALAVALAVRAARLGSVCVELGAVGELDPELPWPEDDWLDRVRASRLVEGGVVRIEGELVYLDRYWREEGQVCRDLVARAAQAPPPIDVAHLEADAGRLFPPGYDEQRAAAETAARQWTTVLTGGPGTGKTTAVAGLLALLAAQQPTRPRVALTAPTGKAAARLQEAVAAATASLPGPDRERLGPLTASTLHRLLGWTPGSRTRFRHDRDNRLPHDVVVVDETSMVSLTMMARLLEAVRPDARLVLVGDADQLASVEAGAVLADLVAGLDESAPGSVVSLQTSHRFGAGIGRLAAAVRDGEADRVCDLLAAGGPEVEWVDPDAGGDVVKEIALRSALTLHAAAEAGDRAASVAALDRHRLLCAHREGPYGTSYWNRQMERWLGEALGLPVGAGWGREWYVGRPVVVTKNDYGLGLYNGDTGVVVRDGDALRAVIAGSDRDWATSRLADVETLHAMTVHKSQGSQAREVTVLLPDEDSRLLTRELFYTAITRAEQRVRVVGREAAVRAAVLRRAGRASGLRQRLLAP